MIAPPGGLARGDEVFLLYGHHSNETLVSEYGFTDVHAPKEICIDHLIVSLFNDTKEGQQKKEVLEARGYWE